MMTFGLVGLVVLLAMGLPIAAVLVVLALILDFTFAGLSFQQAFGVVAWEHSADFVLVAIPLFILMGEIVLRAGIADKMYVAFEQWLTWLPGGLMNVNIATCALLAASSGSSLATAATIATTALPQAQRRNYNERLFLGSLAAGGTLGILIPPSTNMILIGYLTDTSVPQMFLGGVIPGIILALLYMTIIVVICLVRPAWSGTSQESSWRMRLAVLPSLVPPIFLFALVMGSLYTGLATPTEAAALGVLGALALAVHNRRLNWNVILASLDGTIRTTAMIILIVVTAFCLNFVMANIGMLSMIQTFISGLGLSPLQTMLVIIGLYLVLGMFLDTLAMLVTTITFTMPLAVSLGYDPVWFGVMLVVLCEAAILTPPIGVVCFVIQGVRRSGTLNDVFIGVTPFYLAIAAVIVLLLTWPELALWLPTMFYR